MVWTQGGFLILKELKTNLMLVRSLLTRPKRVVLNANAGRIVSSETWLDEVREATIESDLEPARFEVPHDQLEAWAFWINLYNALTLQAMMRNKIQHSVLEFPGFFDCCAYQVHAGSLEFTLTLNEIEHGVLRGNRAILFSAPFAVNNPRRSLILPLEPRIHFALNCGAMSCPPIRSYQAENLESQLELATRSYLQSIRLENGVVILPRLLQWYAKDFGNPLGFVRMYHPELPAKARVRFDAYNWKK
jgi:predicted hotdog family 3-hydroxylacyl-ACP dehydratase